MPTPLIGLPFQQIPARDVRVEAVAGDGSGSGSNNVGGGGGGGGRGDDGQGENDENNVNESGEVILSLKEVSVHAQMHA